MKISVPVAALAVLAACADVNLDRADREVSSIDLQSDLVAVSSHASQTSKAYMQAARRTAATQDLTSALVFLAAGKFVRGTVTGATDAVLADAAITGALAQQTGSTIAPKTAIEGIYTGAKRLNCISTVARVGNLTLAGENQNTRLAAAAMALGAVEEVKITTRESVVREVAAYKQLVTDITPANLSDPSIRIADPAVLTNLTKFQTDLQKCLEGEKKSDKG